MRIHFLFSTMEQELLPTVPGIASIATIYRTVITLPTFLLLGLWFLKLEERLGPDAIPSLLLIATLSFAWLLRYTRRIPHLHIVFFSER